MNVSDLFWNASLEEIKNGYIEERDYYLCLLCGKKIEKGIIYPQDGTFYEAERYVRVHIEKEHESVFQYLINLDKKSTGLSAHQSNILKLFYQGKSDKDIQKELEIGSSSTIRNHRFVFREKERQAKVFLALMELLNENNKKSKFITPHKTAKMVDDRYKVTEDENDKILGKYFPDGPRGPLKTFYMKEKNKLVVLKQIAKHFEPNRNYTEKEVNEILKKVYEDFATIRRYLIEYGFMDRKLDCSKYWLKDDLGERSDCAMEHKKELIQQYKGMKKEAGVYQIKNTQNNKILIESTPNLKTINGKRFQLQMGSHMNNLLQEDWNKYGEKAFVFEVLEVLKEKEDGFFDIKEELKKLEEKWLEKLQPFGERGYHNIKKIASQLFFTREPYGSL